jgi:hypothetical protein
MLTLMSLWHEILSLRLVPAGSRYYLQPINMTPAMRVRSRLVKKNVPDTIKSASQPSFLASQSQ